MYYSDPNVHKYVLYVLFISLYDRIFDQFVFDSLYWYYTTMADKGALVAM